MESKSENIRIIDIAKMAEVSVGTVDRVLHNRGHVSEAKRERVEKVLKEINYQPNMVARFLASRKTYTFAAITPTHTPGSYWELACRGIDLAATELNKFNVNIEYFHFDQYDRNSFIEASERLLNSKFDGVIIATLFGEHVVDFSKRLDETEVPYIYIDSNIVGQNNLAYFGGDSYVSGQIAAKLLIQQIGVDSEIFFAHIKFKHRDISVQMATREAGFMSYLNENGFRGNITHLELDSEHEAESLALIEGVLSSHNAPKGGIVLNSRIYELVELLEKVDKKLTRNVCLIGHDTIDSNVKALKEGKIMSLLSQRPDLQGYDAVKAMGNYFLFGQTYEKDNYMPIDILIKENVDYYRNYKL